MSPKRPRIELKISMTRILTNLMVKISMVSQVFLLVAKSAGRVCIQGRVRSIGQCSTTAIDSNSNAAYEVTRANGQA